MTVQATQKPSLPARSSGRAPAPGSRIPVAAVREPVDVEIVIPAFNESRRLPITLAAMVAHLSGGAAGPGRSCRVVVVDNGSSDDTVAAAQAVAGAGVEVVAIGCSHPGKGAAVLRGLRTSSAKYVGFTDADLSTPLETLGPVLDALEAGAAAAIASRHAPGAQFAVPQSLGRRVGGTVFRTMARQIVPGVRDTQCGFKFFDRVAVQAALTFCRSSGFAFDVELLGQIQAAGGRIAEIPVTWTDDPGSSLRPIRDGVSAVVALTRVRRRIRAAGSVLRAQAIDHTPHRASATADALADADREAAEDLAALKRAGEELGLDLDLDLAAAGVPRLGLAAPLGGVGHQLGELIELAPADAIEAVLDLAPIEEIQQMLESVGPVVQIGQGGLVVPMSDLLDAHFGADPDHPLDLANLMPALVDVLPHADAGTGAGSGSGPGTDPVTDLPAQRAPHDQEVPTMATIPHILDITHALDPSLPLLPAFLDPTVDSPISPISPADAAGAAGTDPRDTGPTASAADEAARESPAPAALSPAVLAPLTVVDPALALRVAR